MGDERGHLLAIVLDVNPVWWGQFIAKNPEASFARCVDSIIVFCNAHLMLHPLNKLCFIVSHGAQNRFVYPRWHLESLDAVENTSLEKCGSDGKYEQFGDLDETIRDEIRDLVLNDNSGEFHSDCVLTGALSMALCFINRMAKESNSTEILSSRLLVIKGSGDNPSQYMDFMSIIFTAQKMNIILDSCILDNESNFLKQACDILDGIYLKLPQLSGLLEYLMYLFLPNGSIRHKLSLPPHLPIGHKAACFCHRVLVDVGYVCSVCLSIFCTFSPICPTCQSTFKVNIPQKVIKKKSKK